MDSEILLKFIGYFPDYPSALSRTLLLFFLGLVGFCFEGHCSLKLNILVTFAINSCGVQSVAWL